MEIKSPMRRAFTRVLIAVPLAVSGVVAVGAAPAMASCPAEHWYDITGSTSNVHMPASGTYFKDGPGGSMTVSVDQSSTVTATASVTAGATVSGIIAEAKIEVSASIALSNSITVGHSYTHDIASGKYGNMQYGAWGYRLSWKYYYDRPQCDTVLLASGTNALAPTGGEGWRYWET